MAPSLDFSSFAEHGISVSLHSLWVGHKDLKLCNTNIWKNEQWALKQAAAAAQSWVFTIDDIKLKTVEDFDYLEWQILSRDSDFPVLFLNLSMAQKLLV